MFPVRQELVRMDSDMYGAHTTSGQYSEEAWPYQEISAESRLTEGAQTHDKELCIPSLAVVAKKYKGETRHLNRLDKHQKAVIRDETMKSSMVHHAWREKRGQSPTTA